MPRTLIATLLLALFTNGLCACVANGVGDPCLPTRPPLDRATDPQCAPDAGCFVGGEYFIETRSVQCRTRVCIVNHWDEQSAPERRSADAYCSCRCAGAVDPGTLCTCPAGFHCGLDVGSGAPGLQGGYCVRDRD